MLLCRFCKCLMKKKIIMLTIFRSNLVHTGYRFQICEVQILWIAGANYFETHQSPTLLLFLAHKNFDPFSDVGSRYKMCWCSGLHTLLCFIYWCDFLNNLQVYQCFYLSWAYQNIHSKYLWSFFNQMVVPFVIFCTCYLLL